MGRNFCKITWNSCIGLLNKGINFWIIKPTLGNRKYPPKRIKNNIKKINKGFILFFDCLF